MKSIAKSYNFWLILWIILLAGTFVGSAHYSQTVGESPRTAQTIPEGWGWSEKYGMPIPPPPKRIEVVDTLQLTQEWIVKPQAGIVVNARVISVYDGDTVTVEIKQRVKVRLLECWAPEVRGKQRPEGLVSRDALRKLIDGREVLLHVPTSKAKHVGNVFSFGRVLGHLWSPDDPRSISQQMVEGGHATRERNKKR